MKKLLVCLSVLSLAAALVGCNTSGTPGGPGTTTRSSTQVSEPNEDTFTLSVPTLSTSIKQGEQKQATIGIKRGKNFDEDVALKFSGLPKGVTLEPANAMIKHSDKEANMTLKAADDAALGEFTIVVTGHPSKGADATNEFKIKVDKK